MYTLTPNDRIVLIVIFATLSVIGAIVSTIYLLAYQKAKKQSETDSGLLARNLQRIIQLDAEKQVIKDSFTELATEYSEKKKLFEQEIELCYARIEVLRIGNETLITKNDEFKERINKLESQVKHKKYIPLNEQKTVESDWWLCTQKIYPQFFPANKYKQDKTISSNDGLIWLFENENDLYPYLVEKRYFKPVEVVEKDWTKATDEELLTEAKRRYTVGITLIPFNLLYMEGKPQNTTISIDDHHITSFQGKKTIWVSSGDWTSVVCSDGEWAEIIP